MSATTRNGKNVARVRAERTEFHAFAVTSAFSIALPSLTPITIIESKYGRRGLHISWAFPGRGRKKGSSGVRCGGVSHTPKTPGVSCRCSGLKIVGIEEGTRSCQEQARSRGVKLDRRLGSYRERRDVQGLEERRGVAINLGEVTEYSNNSEKRSRTYIE